MARSNVTKLPRDIPNDDIETLEDRLSVPVLLPGEDGDLYDAMAGAIRKRLAPRGLLQRMACDDIISLRWEILRHRRFRGKSVDRAFASFSYEFYRCANVETPSKGKLTEDVKVLLALGMVSDDPSLRDACEQFFDRKIGIDRDAILAEAYATRETVKVHDTKLNMLMRQHRSAMRDYEDLRRLDASGSIPDAEIAEEGST